MGQRLVHRIVNGADVLAAVPVKSLGTFQSPLAAFPRRHGIRNSRHDESSVSELKPVGQRGLDPAHFSRFHGSILTQAATALRVFGRLQVAGSRLVVPELARPGLFEPLRGTLSGLQLRHCSTSFFGVSFFRRAGQCSTGCGSRPRNLFGSEVHGNIPPQHLRFPVGIRIRCQRRHHLIHQLERQILMGHFTAAKCQSDL